MVSRGDILYIPQGSSPAKAKGLFLAISSVFGSLPHVLGIIHGVDRGFENHFRTVQQLFEQNRGRTRWHQLCEHYNRRFPNFDGSPRSRCHGFGTGCLVFVPKETPKPSHWFITSTFFVPANQKLF